MGIILLAIGLMVLLFIILGYSGKVAIVIGN